MMCIVLYENLLTWLFASRNVQPSFGYFYRSLSRTVAKHGTLGASLTDRPHKKKLTDRQKNFKKNTCEKR